MPDLMVEETLVGEIPGHRKYESMKLYLPVSEI
jgi:hypothetical protein